MMEYLPERIRRALCFLNENLLYEVRIRVNAPVSVGYGGTYSFLGETGRTESAEKALYVSREEVNDLVFAASRHSLYSVENQLKRGFLLGESGERIGIGGDYVYEGGNVCTITGFKSVCIRIPHEIKGCADAIFEKCFDSGIASLLVGAPPGLGKTTMLRELARKTSEEFKLNVLLCDERGELSFGETGKTVDIIRFADKKTAFSEGVRAMRPDVIVTDELTEEDFQPIEKLFSCGIAVFAGIHRIRAVDLPKGFSFYIQLDGIGSIASVERL